jgi:holo-[acyl-carrier protein] synthase
MLNDDPRLNIAIGTDIVEIDRFRNLEAGSSFFRRVFTDLELAYCRGYTDPSPHLAATFAGKEAVVKAMNSIYRVNFKMVEILRDEDGAPYVQLQQDCDFNIHVSLSHSSSHAVAVALAVKQSSPFSMIEIRGLLDDTVKQILLGSEVS